MIEETDRALPRVLIVSAPALSFKGNNGGVYGPLFRAWPADRIAQIYADNQAPDPELCTRVWPLSLQDIPLDRLLRPLLTRIFRSGQSGATGASQGVVVSDQQRRPFCARVTTAVHLAARAWTDLLLPYPLSDAFSDWVRAFHPEVIFSTAGNIRLMNLTQTLARRMAIPIVADFRDDYPNALYRDSALSAYPRRVLLRRLAKMLALSPAVTTGSEPLAARYRQRYGVPAFAFIPPVPHAELQREAGARPSNPAVPLQFVYIGGLHLNRWEQLIEIGAVLNALPTQPQAMELVIYAPEGHLHQHRAALEAQPGIRVAGALPQEQVFSVLRQADVLVHVESFDPQIQRFTWMSVSTKIPQYMAAGRPILAYGPAALASLQHIESTSSGLVVGSRDPRALATAIQRLRQESGLREHLGQQGLRTARANHDADMERVRFRRLLRDVAAARSNRNR